MGYEFDTTVLGGLPVTIACEANYEWCITHIADKPVKNPKWLYNRIEGTGDIAAIEHQCEDTVGGWYE